MRTSKQILVFICLCAIAAACATGGSNGDRMTSRQKLEFARAEQRLGESLYASGNYSQALEKFLSAQKVYPNDESLQNSLGMVYLANDRYKQAQNHFERALKINPEFLVAKNHLGVALMKQEKYDLAIKHFEELSNNLLYATPENPLANLGWIWFERKEYSRAKQYFLKALDINPCFGVGSHGLVAVYMELLQYEAARRHLQKCSERYPEAAIFHSDLAKVYEALRDYGKARQEWQAVIQLAPERSMLRKEAQDRLSRIE